MDRIQTLVKRTLVLGFLLAAAAALAQPIGETLGPGVLRFHASADAARASLPSYALERPMPVVGGAAATRAAMPRFTVEGDRQVVTIEVPAGTSLYGTGEVTGPLLRNGRAIECWNTDAYGYDDSARSLYQSHPWVLGVRRDGSAFGVLADTTYRCEVDLTSRIVFRADGPAFPIIIIDRPAPHGVIASLAEMTGKMPLPPKWALGYHQCRYSYFPEARVREIAREFRQRDIPCDVIWFDIDYMDSFRVFTFNRTHFPDPLKLNTDLLAEGFHNVWMINPGVKVETGPGISPVFDSGNDAAVWTKSATGSVYRGEVWPGWCRFPDFTAPRVRQWWGPFYCDFLSQGVTGVWNDMNEPAVFNVPSKTMPEGNRHAGDPGLVGNDGRPQGAKAAGDHARYHNVYGMQMIRATRDGILAARPEKRPFVLSRANYIGGQRYGATWTGDNTANWYHLEASIPMALNVGLSGQPFIGPDIGGFAQNGDGALFARWMGFGALLPFARGHTGKENIDKEPWAFGPQVERACRLAIEQRYRLMPYLYTLFEEASRTGLPVARPTFFADPTDPALRSEDDSFLLGDGLLVVAQVVPDRTRMPVPPRGICREFDFGDVHEDLPRLFLRGGSIVPTGPVMEHTGEKPLDPLTLLVCLDERGEAVGELYEDAGDGFGYERGEFVRSRFSAKGDGDRVVVRIEKAGGDWPLPDRTTIVRLLTEGGERRSEPTRGGTIGLQ